MHHYMLAIIIIECLYQIRGPCVPLISIHELENFTTNTHTHTHIILLSQMVMIKCTIVYIATLTAHQSQSMLGYPVCFKAASPCILKTYSHTLLHTLNIIILVHILLWSIRHTQICLHACIEYYMYYHYYGDTCILYILTHT
jgi:hypothetical protein